MKHLNKFLILCLIVIGCNSAIANLQSKWHLSAVQDLWDWSHSKANYLTTLCKEGRTVGLENIMGSMLLLKDNGSDEVRGLNCQALTNDEPTFTIHHNYRSRKNREEEIYFVDSNHHEKVKELCESQTQYQLEDYTSLAKMTASGMIMTFEASYTVRGETPEAQVKIDELLKDHRAEMEIGYLLKLKKSECRTEGDVAYLIVDFIPETGEYRGVYEWSPMIKFRHNQYTRIWPGQSPASQQLINGDSNDDSEKDIKLISKNPDSLSFTFEFELSDGEKITLEATPNP